MSDKRLQKFSVPGLEYVFVPPGLPLIAKGASEPATTSLLVRGGAGTGKTTLAVALAHTIAKEQEGLVLYLTTEFVPTELVYKAKTLGLPEGQVVEWRRPPEALQAGAILVEHLMRTEAGKDVQTGGERKRAAINAIWEVLNGQKVDAPAGALPRPPVRAVVIDAFGLPDAEPADPRLRGELLALIQALEIGGISTILVEEAVPASEHWLPFVADIVFELELWADPETGELLRKLKCPKSRYATAIPGPHEYGLDNGRPNVWPDLVSVGGFRASSLKTSNAPPAVFFTLESEGEYVVCPGGTILLSEYDRGPSVAAAFSVTPGLRIAHVDCGSVAKILLPKGGIIQSPGGGAPISLGWTLIRMHEGGLINAVFLQNLDFYLSHSRSVVSTFHMLEMLRMDGITVCVHGPKASLGPLSVLADFSSIKVSGPIRRVLRRARPCSAVRWLGNIWGMPAAREGKDSVDAAMSQMVAGEKSLSELMSLANELNYGNASERPSADRLLAATLFHLLGDSGRTRVAIETARQSSFSLAMICAWIQSWMGDDLGAARTCLLPKPEFVYVDLWELLSVVYARNETVIVDADRLETVAPLGHGLLWRALSARNDFEKIDGLSRALAVRYGSPLWFTERMQADGRLENDDEAPVREALVRLQTLSCDEEIPSVHRAEIFFNLGVAKERLNDISGAVEAYKQARTINPYLEVATQALAALGSL
jgi:KaiC/GvpD/RAD55 family RecA-like ATPase